MTSSKHAAQTSTRRAPKAAAAAAGLAAFALGMTPAMADTTPASTPASSSPADALNAFIASLMSAQNVSGVPTSLPSGLPTSLPSGLPTSLPSGLPTSLPGGFPISLPSSLPSSLPGSVPSLDCASTLTQLAGGQTSTIPGLDATSLCSALKGGLVSYDPNPATPGQSKADPADQSLPNHVPTAKMTITDPPKPQPDKPVDLSKFDTGAPKSSGEKALANTGPGEVERLMALAALFLAAGAGTVVASRRRRLAFATAPAAVNSTVADVAPVAPVAPVARPAAAVAIPAASSRRRTRQANLVRPSAAGRNTRAIDFMATVPQRPAAKDESAASHH